jgi:Family of unknown function (DUF6056)
MPTAWTSDLVSDPLRRRLQLALIVVMSLCIARHVWLAQYAHPMADDLSYARKDVSQGPLAAALWEYEHWNGRYSSNFLVLYGPLRNGLTAINTYRLVPVLLILATLASTFVFLLACFRPWLPVRDVLTGSLVWTTLYMHAMPDIAEGYYWYTAAVTYQLANVLAILYLTLVVRLIRNPSPWLVPVGVLLLTIVTGFNEVMMLLLVTVHAGGVVISLWRKKAVPVRCWLLLATVLIGATAMIIAPGNVHRSAYFSGSHRLLPSLGMSLLQTARFGAIWLSSPAVLGLGALYILAHDRLSVRIPALGAGFGLKPWMTLLALPTALLLCVFPAYWSTGILGQYRTINVACFFLIPLGFLHLSVWMSHSAALTWAFRLRSAPVLIIAAVFACTGLLFLRNGHRANMDLFKGRAACSDEQLWQRYALLDAAADGSTVIIPQIIDPPKSIYVLDIRRDPQFLQNADYALWFGLKEVRPAER